MCSVLLLLYFLLHQRFQAAGTLDRLDSGVFYNKDPVSQRGFVAMDHPLLLLFGMIAISTLLFALVRTEHDMMSNRPFCF